MEIIAHRRASYDAPENTIASIELGLRQGSDGVEVDIHRTSDGKIAVIHDENTARVSGVSNLVAASTFGELQQLGVGKFGKWASGGFDERIPSLDEALSKIPQGKRIFIEIKCGAEVLPELGDALARSTLGTEQTVLIGFDFDTMRQAKKRFPKLAVLWLVGADKGKNYPPLATLLLKARAAAFDGLNLEQGFPIDTRFVVDVHAAGLKLYTWTVDSPRVARRFLEAGVDGLTTNRPEWLRRELKEQP